MKKVLLSSVAALAVFAAATPVFANNQGQNYEDPATELKSSDLLTDQKLVLLKKLKTVLTMLMLIQLKTNLKQLVKN